MNTNAAAFAFLLQQRRDLSVNQMTNNTAHHSAQYRGHSPRPSGGTFAGSSVGNQNTLGSSNSIAGTAGYPQQNPNIPYQQQHQQQQQLQQQQQSNI